MLYEEPAREDFLTNSCNSFTSGLPGRTFLQFPAIWAQFLYICRNLLTVRSYSSVFISWFGTVEKGEHIKLPAALENTVLHECRMMAMIFKPTWQSRAYTSVVIIGGTFLHILKNCFNFAGNGFARMKNLHGKAEISEYLYRKVCSYAKNVNGTLSA